MAQEAGTERRWLHHAFVPVFHGVNLGPLFLPPDTSPPLHASLLGAARHYWRAPTWLLPTFPGRTMYALRQVWRCTAGVCSGGGGCACPELAALHSGCVWVGVSAGGMTRPQAKTQPRGRGCVRARVPVLAHLHAVCRHAFH
jgi:hypothetical protein